MRRDVDGEGLSRSRQVLAVVKGRGTVYRAAYTAEGRICYIPLLSTRAIWTAVTDTRYRSIFLGDLHKAVTPMKKIDSVVTRLEREPESI
jgi:hypothetical protein